LSIAGINPTQQEPPPSGWERMIPGAGAVPREPFKAQKKPPQSVRVVELAEAAKIPTPPAPRQESGLKLLLPGPLQKRSAWKWLCSTASDFALVALNWLLIGAMLVPLRAAFPRVRLFEYAAGAPVSLLGIAILHAALITLLSYTEGLYAPGIDLRAEVRILGKSILLATTVLGFAYGLQGFPWLTAALFSAAGWLHFGALCTWRWQVERQQRRGESGSRYPRNVLIVGANTVGRAMALHVAANPNAGRVLCGLLDNERPIGDGVVGRVSDLARLARTAFVDEVVLAAPRDRNLTLQVLREARRLRLDVEFVPELFGCKPSASEVDRVGDLPVICLHSEQLPTAALVLKRLVDVAASGLALLGLSPLLGTIAVLIKLDSPGPVFYSALRAGRKARPFRCCKFRTMVTNADDLKLHLRQQNQRSGPFFKIADDPRITRVGRFLRRYSLDELPQLWNVLKGDMSLVGPRPHPLDDFAKYDIEHLARLDVMPGITGLWQVTARRDPSFQRGMELDREYIRTWSLIRDMQILLKTVAAVVRGSGE